ncbi:unnamed protein product [Amoebophrya sp. A120]|nr:unnamed protein product [Amoebophrya sp. A120]|eukprot:GSA120T00016022001.1
MLSSLISLTLQFCTQVMTTLLTLVFLLTMLLHVFPALADRVFHQTKNAKTAAILTTTSGAGAGAAAAPPASQEQSQETTATGANKTTFEERVVEVLRKSFQSANFQQFLDTSLSKTMCNSLGPSLTAASESPETCAAAGQLFLSDDVCNRLEKIGGISVQDPKFRENFVRLAHQLAADKELRKVIGDGILNTLLDEEVRLLLREIFLHALDNENLHSAMVKAIRAGFTAAVQDEELTQMGKHLVIEMLSDARFHRAILKGAMGAIKAGVRDALRDPELQAAFKDTLVDALQDETLHKAGMQGAFEAILPDAFKKDRPHSNLHSSSTNLNSTASKDHNHDYTIDSSSHGQLQQNGIVNHHDQHGLTSASNVAGITTTTSGGTQAFHGTSASAPPRGGEQPSQYSRAHQYQDQNGGNGFSGTSSSHSSASTFGVASTDPSQQQSLTSSLPINLPNTQSILSNIQNTTQNLENRFRGMFGATTSPQLISTTSSSSNVENNYPSSSEQQHQDPVGASFFARPSAGRASASASSSSSPPLVANKSPSIAGGSTSSSASKIQKQQQLDMNVNLVREANANGGEDVGLFSSSDMEQLSISQTLKGRIVKPGGTTSSSSAGAAARTNTGAAPSSPTIGTTTGGGSGIHPKSPASFKASSPGSSGVSGGGTKNNSGGQRRR